MGRWNPSVVIAEKGGVIFEKKKIGHISCCAKLL